MLLTSKELKRVALAKQKIMLALADCCKACCTFSEMAGEFREVFGQFKEPTNF